MVNDNRPSVGQNRMRQTNYQQQVKLMELPLFPLSNVVLFPGMVLPLHIFEPRYREMINRCLDEQLPFGVVLIQDGAAVGASTNPHQVGTVAKIVRAEQLDDGRMNITTLGTERFEIQELHHERSYLTATVKVLPTINGNTKLATQLAQTVRPRIVEYVDLLSKVNNTELTLDRLPEDPMTLAFLIGIALQTPVEDKQMILALSSVPEMLVREYNLLSHEIMLLQYMAETIEEVQMMNGGLTGAIFPN